MAQSILNAIFASIEAHWQVYSAAAVALGVAVVCTMPPAPPRSISEWWTWIRDSLQTAVPAARHAHTNPTQDNSKKQENI